jgi:hypothetical protein
MTDVVTSAVERTETPSMMARAARTPLARLLVMIAAATTGIAGVVTAIGAAVVNVVQAVAEANARRSNAEIDRRLDAVETRANGDFGVKLETKSRQEKDAEITAELERVWAAIARRDDALSKRRGDSP